MLFVESRGTPYERGRQYGEQLAALLRRRKPANLLQPLAPAGSVPASDGHAAAAQMLRYLERHEPSLVDEMRGMAAGAGVSFQTIFHINAHSAVQYIQHFPLHGPPNHLRAPGAPGVSHTPGVPDASHLPGAPGVLGGSHVSGVSHTPGVPSGLPASGTAAMSAHAASPDPDGCTNVAFASTKYGPLLGKTNDGGAPVPPERQPAAWVLQHVYPEAGPEYFLLSTVGLLAGVAGLNAAGFAVGQSASQVVPGQSGFGVPTTLILRPLLERCATVTDALDLLASRDLAGKGLNMMLLDAADTVKAAEKSGSILGVRSPNEQGTLYFSNHSHTSGIRDLPPRHDHDNSHRRWAFLTERFDSRAGDENGEMEHTRQRMRELISSHGRSVRPVPCGPDGRNDAAGAPALSLPPGSPASPGAPEMGAGAICQHGPDMFTSLGLLIEPRERRMWVADGPPCTSPFVERRLGQAAG